MWNKRLTNYKIKKSDFLLVRSQEKGIEASKINKIKGKKLIKDVDKFDNLLLEDLIK